MAYRVLIAQFMHETNTFSKLPTTLVAISGYGQPVIATGLAILLLGEIPSLGSVLGAAVVIAGLLIATFNRGAG